MRQTDANGDFLDTEGDVIEEPDEDSDYMYVFPDTIAATNDPNSSTLMVYDAEGNLATDTVDLELVMLDHDLDGDTDPMMWVVVDTDWTADGDTGVLDPVNTGVVLTAEELTVLDAETMFRAEDPNDEEAEVGILVDYEAAKANLDEKTAALEANQDGTKTIDLTEQVRKAQAVYDFFADQKGDAEADLRAGKLKFDREVDEDTEDAVPVNAAGVEVANPDDNAGDIDRYVLLDDVFTKDDYEVIDELEDKRVDAADALKEAYDERVAASDDVEENLKSAEAYLDQLVGLREYEKELADVAAVDADEDDLDENGLTEDQVDANEALQTAEAQRDAHDDLQNRSAVVQNLVEALLEAKGTAEDDDGQALVDAISSNYDTASDASETATEAMNAVEGLSGADGLVAGNTGRISTVEGEIGLDEDGNGMVMLPDGTMGSRIDDHDQKLMLKKQYIDNLGTAVGFNAATNEGTVMLADGTMGSRIDLNAEHIGTERTERMAADTALGVRIDTNVAGIEDNSTAIAAETTARMEYDTMLGGRIDAEEMARMAGDTANTEAIMVNTGAIADNMAAISGNSGMINDNRNMIGANSARIGELSDDLDIVRSGVAASMALAGMPAINGRGIAIGVGSFDGESAFAVGFQIQGEMASFQIGVTSSGGETGASAGVGFQF